ncbi:MAG TPA: CDP-diacylglycerol--serine O-phosphatidyltransferase [Peptococcaceae bacterium]|nr:CDP-diacylglycerol--serine O-phosphatidyltransferase [Peptococcaceae bacterium]
MKERSFDSRVLPCLFTLANLLFGFLAIIFSFEQNLKQATAMVMLSVLMDSLDGKVARRFKANSDFGKELDSLSDVISFGLAPAVLIYVFVYEIHWPYWGILVSAFFAMCGAVRLARFNLLPSTDYFIGVPITFAGGFMALLLLFMDKIPWQAYPAVMILLSLLMISSVHVPKLGK